MPKGRWTIIVVPQGASASRMLEVSPTAVKLVGSLVVAALGLALVLGYATITKTVDMGRASRVERENQRLATELAALHGRLSILNDTIAHLERRDAQYRLLANLEPIDPQVQAVGIGGPRPPRANDPEANSVLVERAGEVRVDLNALIRRADLLAESFREAADSLTSHHKRLEATPSIMPTQGWLTSAFSSMRFHPILHKSRPHEGIDVTAPEGTPIEAPANGKVVYAGWETGYGNMVDIDHGYGIVTRFAHASRLLVKVGQKVTRGQRIALVGSTGLADGPHLHYEVHVNGRPVNPLRYILPSVVTD